MDLILNLKPRELLMKVTALPNEMNSYAVTETII